MKTYFYPTFCASYFQFWVLIYIDCMLSLSCLQWQPSVFKFILRLIKQFWGIFHSFLSKEIAVHIQKNEWTLLFCFPITNVYEDLWHSSGPSMKYPKEICFICSFNPINLLSIILLSRPLLKEQLLLRHYTINLLLIQKEYFFPLWFLSLKLVLISDWILVTSCKAQHKLLWGTLWRTSWKSSSVCGTDPCLVQSVTALLKCRPVFSPRFVNPLKEFVLLSCLKICMQLKFKARNCILQSQFASVLICSLNVCEIKI